MVACNNIKIVGLPMQNVFHPARPLIGQKPMFYQNIDRFSIECRKPK